MLSLRAGPCLVRQKTSGTETAGPMGPRPSATRSYRGCSRFCSGRARGDMMRFFSSASWNDS